jgi:Ni/Co efflux regulator RcnB
VTTPSMRARLFRTAAAVVLMTAVPAAHAACAQGLNDIVRNLNNTMNPNDAQRRDDRARREDQFRREDQGFHRDGRSGEGQYRRGDRPTTQSLECNRNGGHRGDYGGRRNTGQRWQPGFGSMGSNRPVADLDLDLATDSKKLAAED